MTNETQAQAVEILTENALALLKNPTYGASRISAVTLDSAARLSVLPALLADGGREETIEELKAAIRQATTLAELFGRALWNVQLA